MPKTETIIFGASLRSVCRIYVYNTNPFRLRFAFYKLLQRIPRPSMQSRSHALVSFDSFSNIGQVLENNNFTFRLNGFLNNVFANNVICCFNMPSFSARDSLQTAFSRAITVGLKFDTSCKKHISFVFKLSTSINDTVRGCCKIIFAFIYGKYFSLFFNFPIRKIEDKIKKLSLISPLEFSFFECSLFKIFSLEISSGKFTFNTPFFSVERKGATFKGIGFLS